jgi:hypothetical protein
MKKLRLPTFLAVIVFTAVGAPANVDAAGCCPGSGCCGTGQTYVGQQLFPNPAAPAPVSMSPAANPPQVMKSTKPINVSASARKTAAAQSQSAAPIASSTQQAARESLEALTFSCAPCLGNLW